MTEISAVRRYFGVRNTRRNFKKETIIKIKAFLKDKGGDYY